MSRPDIARLVDTARNLAAAAQHNFVGTEHLLAAALTAPDGDAARALAAARVPLDGFAEELLSGLPRAEAASAEPPRLSRFAERAVAELEKGQSVAAVLLRNPRGRIASVLSRRKADLNALQRFLAPQAEPKTRSPQKTKQPFKQSSALSAASASSASKQLSAEPAPARERHLPPHLRPSAPRPLRPSGRPSWLLLLAVPLSVVLRGQGVAPLWVFLAACLGVIPLEIGRAHV